MELRYGISKGAISLFAVGLLMACTSTLMFVHNPFPSIIRMFLSLSDGSMLYKIWSAPPYNVYMKIFIFNVTNSEEFLSGKEKMNVTQHGPYVYREILTNQNATFNDQDGTVTYQPHRELIFDRELSVGDPHEDKVFTTNIPLVGLQSFLKDQSIFTNIGFAALSRTLGSEPIVERTVHEYLWGYNDTLIKYAHTFIPSWIDFEQFGVLERLIDRDNSNRVTIVSDPSKYHSKTDRYLTEEERQAQFHVAKWNGLAGIKEWGFDELSEEAVTKCDLVEGSFDGTVFPKDLRPNRTLSLFRKAFCRPVPITFVREAISKDGFKQFEYKLADNMFEKSDANKCFCYKGRCESGFQSIAPCYYGIPITLSQPHFYNADPAELETVHGLSPDETKHGSLAAIQPDLGVPLSGSLRIQINLDVGKTRANYKTARFNDLKVPLFWIEITSGELPSLVYVLMYLACNVLPVSLVVVKYLLGLGGIALISGSAVYTLVKTRVRLPRGISLNASSEYTSIPILAIPAEFLDKCERRLSLRPINV